MTRAAASMFNALSILVVVVCMSRSAGDRVRYRSQENTGAATVTTPEFYHPIPSSHPSALTGQPPEFSRSLDCDDAQFALYRSM